MASPEENITLTYQKKMWAKNYLITDDKDSDKFWSQIMKLVSALRRLVVKRVSMLRISDIEDSILAFDFYFSVNQDSHEWKIIQTSGNECTVDMDKKSRKLILSNSDMIRIMLMTLEEIVLDVEFHDCLDSNIVKMSIILGQYEVVEDNNENISDSEDVSSNEDTI